MKWLHGRIGNSDPDCPPSAAVRQCSMARIRRWNHVSQERFFSTKLSPAARMMSATSKGGRFHFLISFRDRFTISLGLDNVDVVQRIAELIRRWRCERCRWVEVACRPDIGQAVFAA